jgi:predicted phosphodiesterase
MRLLILSDLHHEIWREHAVTIDPAISKPDVVILAGDIDLGARAVDWAARTFPGLPVLYVHGNHEGYGKNLDEVQEDIAAAGAAAGNVYFLDGGEFILGRVRFLGATLWTDFRLFGDDRKMLAMLSAGEVMNDYRRIRLARQGYRKLRPVDTATIHARQKAWLTAKLDEPFDGVTVVVSHMAPSMKSVEEDYRDDIVSAAYASNCEDVAARANLWVHGHMHTSFDYRVGKCRVVSNPCGYIMPDRSPQNPDFDPNFIIEV